MLRLIINKDDFIYNNNDGYARRMIGLDFRDKI